MHVIEPSERYEATVQLKSVKTLKYGLTCILLSCSAATLLSSIASPQRLKTTVGPKKVIELSAVTSTSLNYPIQL